MSSGTRSHSATEEAGPFPVFAPAVRPAWVHADAERFCRPGCPTRGGSIRDAACSAPAAWTSGALPCLHCRPDRFAWIPAEEPGVDRPEDDSRLAAILEARLAGIGNAAGLAATLGWSPDRLRRVCGRVFGAPPSAVLDWLRACAARRLLDDARPLPAPDRLAALTGFRSVAALRRTLARAGLDREQAVPAEPEARPSALVLRLDAVRPFPGRQLLEFLALRTLNGLDAVEDHPAGAGYRRGWQTPDGPANLMLYPDDSGIDLRLDAPGRLHPDELIERAESLFDPGAPVPEILERLGPDPLLGPAVRAEPGRRVPGAWDPFELAIRAVLGQQVSVAAARTHAQRLLALCAGDEPGAFPSPERIAATDLTALAMPGARQSALSGLATAVAEGRVDFARAPQQVRADLLALRGIGPWTADYIALRGLGDRDAFPAGDLVVRQALAGGGPLPAERTVLERSAPWRPLRAYAVMHLWQLAASARG
jgi:AraC family transcriptional regulator of adaptative response / DNA-3-methyladenine glycosylase II